MPSWVATARWLPRCGWAMAHILVRDRALRTMSPTTRWPLGGRGRLLRKAGPGKSGGRNSHGVADAHALVRHASETSGMSYELKIKEKPRTRASGAQQYDYNSVLVGDGSEQVRMHQ